MTETHARRIPRRSAALEVVSCAPVTWTDLPPPLPRLLEVKRTLDGREKRFDCRVLARAAGQVVVLFVAPGAIHVHGVDLPAGTVTFGHFWEDRPYNVYHWLRPADGAGIGAYVNLSAETHLDGDTLTWLDLIVDVLVLPGRAPAILDEDELPRDAVPDLRARIADAQVRLLNDLPGLREELETARTALWPLASRHLTEGT